MSGKPQRKGEKDMKKIKKIMAMLLAMVMVLGMTVSTMAADSATITVENLDANATISSVQVIAPDTSKPSGWNFINGAGTAYASAFNLAPTEENFQRIIWSLILYKDAKAKVPEGISPATPEQIQNALTSIVNYETVQGNSFDVKTAGVYAIKATTTNEEVYVYSPMAAYVAFEVYDPSTGKPSGLTDVTVNAKKTTLEVEKNSDETDGVVAVGKEVEYTITTTIPYIKESVTDVKFTLKDSITGATYNKVNNNLDAVVYLGGREYPGLKFEISDDGSNFTVDLSSIAADRKNANKTLVITYKATVTGLKVDNKVEIGDGEHNWNTNDTLYTATVTMTKNNEDGTVTLSGAGFKLYRTEDNMYAVAEEKEGVYVITSWTQEKNDATEMVTGADGTFVVKGLDDSAGYKFEEVTAPEGYSINEIDAEVKWDENSKKENKTGTASMNDTKLSALPETGGIGTTIFTIGGCVIMIAAAGLFFASRRKSAK